MPFWFWNDDLQDDELIRQVRDLHDAGCGGFVLHPRPGLSARVGYLTPEFFRLAQLVVEEAARLGMQVVLYDEASYPSGSACGRIVAEDPTLAARCLWMREQPVLPGQRFVTPLRTAQLTHRFVAAVAARSNDQGGIVSESLTVCEPREHEIIEMPGEGFDRLMVFWDSYSGGTMRGIGDEQDDGHATAPAAADILNPKVTQRFLELTHDRYYEALSEHFGQTVVAMFTDEPSPMGRDPKRSPPPQPYSPGLFDQVAARWPDDVKKWLPALWHDCGERTDAFREAYARGVQDRLNLHFYAPMHDWCAQHEIALTGHPHYSNELTTLRHFDWPGQDMVHRWVVPDHPSGVVGADSTAPRVATSAARLAGSDRAATEFVGGYGWHLTFDEFKWLADWHLIRGNNLLMPHAVYYSIRGHRVFESPPDLGLHHIWRPHLPILSRYVARVTWLLRNSEPTFGVGVMVDGASVAWDATAALQQAQIEHTFIDTAQLQNAVVRNGELCVGKGRFSSVVVDQPDLPAEAAALLEQLENQGGVVIQSRDQTDVIDRIRQATPDAAVWDGPDTLRLLHHRWNGQNLWLLCNEGETAVEGNLNFNAELTLQLWRPLDGSASNPDVLHADGSTRCSLRLERRELIALVEGEHLPDLAEEAPPAPPAEVLRVLEEDWQASQEDGGAELPVALGDWSQFDGLELFTGRVLYRCTFNLTAEEARAGWLDLGDVGEMAQATLNDTPIGFRGWSPYRFDVSRSLREGENRLELVVTNSMANRFCGRQLPSGLMGPVRLLASGTANPASRLDATAQPVPAMLGVGPSPM